MLSKKHIVVFLKKENNSYSVIKTKRVIPPITEIRYKKGNTQNIDTNLHNYSRGLKYFYFIDIDNDKGGQIHFKSVKSETMNAKMRDLILSEKIIDQLSTNLHQTSIKERLIDIAIGGFVGGLIGFIIKGMV